MNNETKRVEAPDDLIAEAKAFIKAIDNERYPGGVMSGGGDRPIKFREMASFAKQYSEDLQTQLDITNANLNAVIDKRIELQKDLDDAKDREVKAKAEAIDEFVERVARNPLCKSCECVTQMRSVAGEMKRK